MSYYGDLEDGVVRLLLDLKYVPAVPGPPPVPASGYLKHLAVYGGANILQEREQLLGGAPMVAVQAQPSPPKRKTIGGAYYHVGKVAVHAVARSLRGQAIQRRGSGITDEPPGIYTIVEDIYDRLVNKQPVNSAGTTVPGTQWGIADESILVNEKDLQVWVLVFETMCQHDWPQIARASLRDLTSAYGEGKSIDAVHGDKAFEHPIDTWP